MTLTRAANIHVAQEFARSQLERAKDLYIRRLIEYPVRQNPAKINYTCLAGHCKSYTGPILKILDLDLTFS